MTCFDHAQLPVKASMGMVLRTWDVMFRFGVVSGCLLAALIERDAGCSRGGQRYECDITNGLDA